MLIAHASVLALNSWTTLPIHYSGKPFVGGRNVRGGRAWARALQRLEHPLLVLERTRAEEREGEAGVSEALL